MAYKFTKSMEVGNTNARFSMLSFKTFLENGHLLGFHLLGNAILIAHKYCPISFRGSDWSPSPCRGGQLRCSLQERQ